MVGIRVVFLVLRYVRAACYRKYIILPLRLSTVTVLSVGDPCKNNLPCTPGTWRIDTRYVWWYRRPSLTRQRNWTVWKFESDIVCIAKQLDWKILSPLSNTGSSSTHGNDLLLENLDFPSQREASRGGSNVLPQNSLWYHDGSNHPRVAPGCRSRQF